jgi:N-acetylglucosamine kinase-like BadF-type ATPase
MKIFGGIDAGGTRTRLALVREDGVILGFAEGGCSSFVELGAENSLQALRRLKQEAWASAGLEVKPVDGLFIGSGSILHSDDIKTNCTLAVSAGLAIANCVRAENDAWNALAGGLLGRPGILLVAGTGSACLGRNLHGQTWRAGGWGHLLDDVGSAYQLGQAAMVAATRATDGRGKATALTAAVCEKLGLQDLKQIYRKLHQDGVARAEVAALAPQVVAEAEAGDEISQCIISKNIEGLVEMARTVARHLKLLSPEIALTGGLLTNAMLFREELLKQLAAAVPGFSIADGGVVPVLGAVILAYESSFQTSSDEIFLKNLRLTAARFPNLQPS